MQNYESELFTIKTNNYEKFQFMICCRNCTAGQANLWFWSVGSGELWSVRNDESLPAEVRAAAVPKENADQPVGQWYAFDITVTGDRITIVNNGITVIDNVLYPSLVGKGRIGLQHHGGINEKTGKLQGASCLVQFRNIRIKEL